MKKILIIFLSLTFVGLPLFGLIEPVNAETNDYYSVTKDKVGLNVHWALGGVNNDLDSLYRSRLAESKTRWVREHFNTEVFFDDRPQAWYDRYDYVMSEYAKRDYKVVGMLAYGKEADDYRPPVEAEWRTYLQFIVGRYKDYVDVWEVWNEPDSPDYLEPNNPEAFQRIMEIGYEVIKEIDPTAVVLNGGLTWPNYYFAEPMYQNYGDSFDALAIHVYYCNDWSQLSYEMENLANMVDKYRPGERFWITELGCSTGGTGITESQQRSYVQELTENLINTGRVENILLYNIRNYDWRGSYEDNFGLLDVNMNPRPIWNWYSEIPRGPYEKWRDITLEQQKAAELRNELETKYFGEGLIPISEENWPTVVNAYTYGGYNAHAIVQAIRFGGKTVHPTLSWSKWKEMDDYKAYINKDWTGGMIIHAYGKPRILITTEQQKAEELKNELAAHYDLGKLKIDQTNWITLVNAYVYGGYPIDAISRAIKYGGKTVHPNIPWSEWKEMPDYQEYITKPI